MRSSAQVAFALVQRLKARGVAQVEGYNGFRFLRETEAGVVVSREAGQRHGYPLREDRGGGRSRSEGSGRLCRRTRLPA